MAANSTGSSLPLSKKNEAIVDSWTDTKIKYTKITHTWRIHDFSCCSKETGQSLQSERFSSGAGDKWYLKIYPNGLNATYKDYLSYYLYLESCKTSPVDTTFRLAMNGGKFEKYKNEQCVHSFTKGTSWHYEGFIKRNDLFKRANEFLPNDTLTLSCEIIITENIVNVSGIKEMTAKFDEPSNNLLENLGHLLDTKKLSDVILVTAQREFQAHKLILSAHSSVFSAMFEHEMLEQKQNRVDIIDLDQNVVEKMLQFIYTGKVDNIAEMADSLLVAADKYDIDSLKLMCGKQLKESLSMENALDILILADLHNVDWLKRQTIQFFNRNKTEIINTKGFESAAISHPHLIIEAFVNSAIKKTDNLDEDVERIGEAMTT